MQDTGQRWPTGTARESEPTSGLAGATGTAAADGRPVDGSGEQRARRRLTLPRPIDGRDIAILAVTLTVCALVNGVNMDGWPGRLNEDEGTYTAQAYAMQRWGQLAHYPYWYDHPFGGWLQIAVYTTLTGAFDRTATAVTAAREFMFWVHLASCALLYLLARRLGFRRVSATVAVVLFSLSPLAVWFHRMVFLDNISLMWALAALACAASPRRSTGTAVLSGILLGVAFWSKESALLLLPGVYLLLWQNHRLHNARTASIGFLGVFAAIVGSFVLFAVGRGELNWLVRTTEWQIFDRSSSGSILTDDSPARDLADLWLRLDPLLIGAGVVASLPALAVRPLRAVAGLLLIQIAMMFRDGYLPYSYVAGLLPFAALCVAGVADALVPRPRLVPRRPRFGGRLWPTQNGEGGRRTDGDGDGDGYRDGQPGHRQRELVPYRPPSAVFRLRIATVFVIAACGLVALPVRWAPSLRDALTADATRPSYDATRWFLRNTEPGGLAITNDNIWLDLVRAGVTPEPVWHWRISDPEVRTRLTDWRDVDYLVLDAWMSQPDTLQSIPLLADALAHSVSLRSFGDDVWRVTIYQVVDDESADRLGPASQPAAG